MVYQTNKALNQYLIRALLLLSLSLLGACSEQGIDLDNPEVVYQNYCFACHDTGAAGAPRLSDHAFWQQAGNHTQRLYKSTLKGVRAMPAKGTCLSCTDQQLTQTVDWMLQQAQ